MKRRWKMNMAVAALALLTACGEELPEMDESEASGETFELDENDGDTLMVGLTNGPDSFNPFDSPGEAGRWAQRFMYESLLDMPSETEFEPKLGEFDTEDNQVFTVTLNEDATWSDGEPVTAEDVAFTLNTIANPDAASSLGTNIAMLEGTTEAGVLEEGLDELPGVEVLDEKTVELTTKAPVDESYISEFLGFNVLIAPKHVFEDVPAEELATSEPAVSPTVFSGPYKFVEYQEEDYLHLEANENYYRGAPEIQEVFLRVMNGTALLTEFQAGNLHMAAGGGIGMVAHQDVALLEEIEGLEVEEQPSANTHYMIVNTTDPRFEDPRVRQAFAYALDRESLVTNLMDDRAEVIPSAYPPTSPYYHESLEPREYDPEKARELLEEADFDFDEEVTFVVPTGNAVREQAGDLIEQWLVDVGVNVNQQNYDFTTWLSMAREQDYDLGLRGTAHRVDPNLQNSFGTGSVGNDMGYSNPEVDELLAQGNAGTSFEERQPVYEEFQEVLYEEMPLIPLYSDNQFSVKVDYLDGGMNEFWAGSLHDVHEWRLNP